MFTLIITAPDGTETRNHPVAMAAHTAVAACHILRTVAPWLTMREARGAALQVVKADGVTRVHTGTGYRFRVETEESTDAR